MAEEYIGREALIKGIADIINTAPMIYVGGLGLALTSVRSAPAADVAPVRHGRWNVSRTDYGWNGAEYPTHCKCSLCGREIPYQDQDRYCPNCGAKMDKEDTNGSQTD